MSRTDKDRPYEVKVRDNTLDREVRHNHEPRRIFCITGEVESTYTTYSWKTGEKIERTSTKRTGYYGTIDNPCDIEAFDSTRSDGGRYRFRDGRCGYSLPFHEARWHTAPPKWYRDHVYHNPERVRTRDTLLAAKKDWNANGDTEIEVEERQGRHSATWLWW